jgi:hypothetical protein
MYCIFITSAVLYAFDRGGRMEIVGEREKVVGTSIVYWVCRCVDGD